MIYLDYSATTPVAIEVLDTMTRTTKEFIGNANSLNGLGIKSKELLNSAIKQIAELFSVLESELTFTSSSTESNNMALIGVSLANLKAGKHLIVSKLVTGILIGSNIGLPSSPITSLPSSSSVTSVPFFNSPNNLTTLSEASLLRK